MAVSFGRFPSLRRVEGRTQKNFRQSLDATVARLEYVGRASSVSGCCSIWREVRVGMQRRISACIPDPSTADGGAQAPWAPPWVRHCRVRKRERDRVSKRERKWRSQREERERERERVRRERERETHKQRQREKEREKHTEKQSEGRRKIQWQKKTWGENMTICSMCTTCEVLED